MTVDSLGYPLRFLLTRGQDSDFLSAIPLLSHLPFLHAIADKGYDSNEIVNFICQQQAIAVIPPKSNRKVQREYDKHLYKERNLVQQAQTIQADCHTLREDGAKLPIHALSRCYYTLARLTVNTA
jgi:transposase